MVAIVSGKGTGLERSSAFVLGSEGQLGGALLGRGGDGVFVNAANGNLVVTRQDEFLIGLGPDTAISRTYNSQATVADGDNGDQWRMGHYRRIVGSNGDATLKRIDWDGSETVYTQVSANNYVCKDGAGAYDTLTWSAATSEWAWTDGNTRAVEAYNAAGQLNTVRDADGNGLLYSYTNNLITRIWNASGEWTDLAYSGTLLTHVSTHLSTGDIVRTRYGYDTENRLSTVIVDHSPADGAITDSNLYWTSYGYSGSSKRISSITQLDGSSLQVDYDTSFRVTKLTQAVGGGAPRITNLSYGANGTTTITDQATTSTVRLRYDAADQLVSITHPATGPGESAQTVSFAYNANGDVISRTDGSGRRTAYTYDASGNMLSSQDAAGNRVERTYDASNKMLSETRFLVPDPDGPGSGGAATPLVTRYAYNSTGHLRFVVSAEGEVTEYIYNSAGQQTSAIGYAGSVYTGSSFDKADLAAWAAGLADRSTVQRTDMTYQSRGEARTTTRFGSATSAGVGIVGNDTSVATSTYDHYGRLLTSKNSASGAQELFEYDGLDRVTKATDLAGNQTTFVFSDPATTTTVNFANGLTRSSVYNKTGELLSVTESGSDFTPATTANTYDSLGRLRMVTDPTQRKTHMLYDKAGRKVADIGPDGATTEYRYDGANNLTSTTRYVVKANVGLLVDVNGNALDATLAGVRPASDPGDEWTFNVYDAANRLVQTIDALGSTSVFTYDGASQLVSTRSYATSLSTTVVAELKARAANPNYWSNAANGALWGMGNLTLSAASPIDNVNAYQIAVQTSGAWHGLVGDGVAGLAGDVVSITLLLKAGTVDSAELGLWGYASGWGANADTVGISVSGPGAVTQHAGGLFYVTGLDATKETRVTLTRTLAATETVQPYLYVKNTDFAQVASGSSLIVAGPYLGLERPSGTILPVASAADRLTRDFHDNDGRLVATLDGAGGLKQIVYDEAGRKIREIGYATATASGLRASGSLSALIASVGTSAKDQRVDYVYDGRGLLRFRIDALGGPTEYSYDARDNVIRTTAYAGWLAPAAGYSMAYVQAQLSSTGLAANAANRISRVTYDGAGRAAFAIDALGGVTAFKYDAANRAVKQTAFESAFTAATDQIFDDMTTWANAHAADAGNRVTRSLYDQAGHLAYLVDGEGYLTEYKYDTAGRTVLESRYDGIGAVGDGTTKGALDTLLGEPRPAARADLAYAYDAAGRLLQKTDGIGAVTRYAYDGLGQVTDTTLAYGTADASTTRRTYDAAGRVKTETMGYGATPATVQFAYDALGNLVSRTDARDNVTAYTHDTLGRVLTQSVPVNATPADNLVTTSEYDGLGNLVKVTDARGYATFTYYDKLGRTTLQIDRENFATETQYTAFGEVYLVRRYATRAATVPTVAAPPTVYGDLRDAATVFGYDKLGRAVIAYDAEGQHEDFAYNIFGERSQTTGKAGGVVTQAYDRRGLLTAEKATLAAYLPSGAVGNGLGYVATTFAYDARGNLTTRTEATGLTEERVTGYVYDKANRLLQVVHEAVTVTAADLSATSTLTPIEYRAYNRRGELIQSIDAGGGKVTAWYDALGRKTDEVDAVGTLTHWTYDANGNALTMRVYDTAVTAPGTPLDTAPPAGAGSYRQVAYAYDRANRLTTTTVAALAHGAVSGTNFVTGTSDLVTQRFYDKAGNLVREMDGAGNSTWFWYDGLGRQTAQVDRENYLSVWTRDHDGNAALWDANGNATLADDAAEIRYATKLAGAFDAGTSVAALKAMAGSNAADRVTNFTYDRNGRRLTETRLGVLAASISGTGALTTATQAATIAYTYNALGLVASRTEANGDLTTYAYDAAGRLKTTTGTAFIDNMGNSVKLVTDQYLDGLGNVVRTWQRGHVEDNAADRIATSLYGPDGRLMSTTDAAGFTRSYGYDLAGRVVMEKYSRLASDGTTTVTEASNTRYDAAGRVVLQAQGTLAGGAWTFGAATRLAYNAHGEVTGKGLTASPASAAVYQETFDYDAGGRLWRTNSGDGSVKLMVYDKAGNQSLTLASAGADLSGQSVATLLASLTGAGATGIANATTTLTAYDKRGSATAVREPGRQLSYNGSAYVTADLGSSRTYNAFGEVTSETDARGYVTDFGYNALGRMVLKQSPTVSWTAENGAVATARPTETYSYDIAGRLVGVQDANGNLTTRTLEAGTGHNGTEALVHVEHHADGGKVYSWHNVFGDARMVVDELGQEEVRGFDAMGRVTEVIHRGASGAKLSDYYTLDGLGRRIRHWNSQLGSLVVERTDHDREGRVVSQIDYAGGTTSWSYSWSGTLATTGLGTFGGWIRTTTNAASLSASDSLDYFGRTVARSDYGAHAYGYTFDLAGRLVSQTGVAGQSQSFAWLNTGRLYQLVDTAGTGKNVVTARYGYDEAGNRTYEGYAGTVYSFNFPSGTTSATKTLQSATIAYDALGRVTTFTDRDASNNVRITVATQYDKAGNVRRVQADYPNLAAGSGTLSSDKYYRYDSMNRMVTADGVLSGTAGASGTTIVRGATGYDATYDLAGRRATQTRDAALTGYSSTFIWDAGHGPGSGAPLEAPAEGVNGHQGYVEAQFSGVRREEYGYNADGSLATVKFAETAYTDNENGSVTAIANSFRAGELRAEYQRDLLGRITRYREFSQERPDEATKATHDRHDIHYDARGNVQDEVTVQLKKVGGGGSAAIVYDTYVTVTDNHYTADGRLSWTGADTYKNGSDSALPDTRMDYTYAWYDGARIATTSYDKDTGTSNALWDSTYAMDGLGRVASVDIDDGRRRTVSFAYAPEGQVLNRAERSSASLNPEDQRYFVAGRQVGELTSDGNGDPSQLDYATNLNSVRNWTPNPQSAPFRWNGASGITRGTFGVGAGYEAINPYGNGAQSTSGSYQVRDGETLQSIASSAWGDASLWYLIAEANGLGAGAQLIAGQNLILPDRVTNAHNSSDAFRVYDPNSALGDLSPTSAKPPKKPGACAVMGQILMVAIAVGVTIATGGALASLSPVAAGAIAGAAGSVASQAFGMATGLQQGFDWKGVAMGAIGGAVGGQLAGMKAFDSLSRFAEGAMRGLVSSVVTQGIGVATGLQDKFSWAGVAGAALGGGFGNAFSKQFGGLGPAASQVISSAASGVANAGIRSLITGTSFGDNLIAALPDIIGGTVGDVVAQRLTCDFARSPRREQPSINAEWDGAPQAVETNGYVSTDGLTVEYSGQNAISWYQVVAAHEADGRLDQMMPAYVGKAGGPAAWAFAAFTQGNENWNTAWPTIETLRQHGDVAQAAAHQLELLQLDYDRQNPGWALATGTGRAIYYGGETIANIGGGTLQLGADLTIGLPVAAVDEVFGVDLGTGFADVRRPLRPIISGAEATGRYFGRVIAGRANPLTDGRNLIASGLDGLDNFADDVSLTYQRGGVAALYNRYAAGGARLSLSAASVVIPVGQVSALGRWQALRGAGRGTVEFLDPAELRWSQRTAGGGGRVDPLRESMATHGYIGDPIDVVHTTDGLTTLDHTRAGVALELGIAQIPARVWMPDDPLPSDMISGPRPRFGPSTTWGEALSYRASRQTPPLSPTGTSTPPRLPPRR